MFLRISILIAIEKVWNSQVPQFLNSGKIFGNSDIFGNISRKDI